MSCKVRAAFLLLVVIAIGPIHAQINPCRTPRNESGDCKNIRQCKEILGLLTSTQRTTADLDYVKQSQCGFELRDPLVCCPVRNVAGQNPPVNNNGNNNGNNNNNNNNRPPIQNEGNAGARPNNLLPQDCGRDLQNRIVGGNVTALDEFPWMALLEYRKPSGKTTACGGALISNRYVLTAAHCLKGRALPTTWSLIGVRLGEYNTATDQDCIPDGEDGGVVCADDPITVGVEEQLVHEGYDPLSSHQRNDIALLRLTRNVAFTNFVRPVCLPSGPGLSRNLQVAGWGKTADRSESEVKLKVTLPLVEKSACLGTYEGAGVGLGSGQLCAGGERGKDSCRGDSGGPLMQQERDASRTSRWVEVGVVSFGPSPCGMPGWPGVYTKVYDFLPWIYSKLRP